MLFPSECCADAVFEGASIQSDQVECHMPPHSRAQIVVFSHTNLNLKNACRTYLIELEFLLWGVARTMAFYVNLFIAISICDTHDSTGVND